jgi:hypothetical protein
VLARALLVVLGVLTALAGAVVHRHVSGLGPVALPWGLASALWTTAAVAWAASGLVRAGAAWVALGWTAVVLLQQSVRPGSYLVAGDVVGWSFMGGGLLVLAGIVVLHPAGRRGARSSRGSGTPVGPDRRPTTLER